MSLEARRVRHSGSEYGERMLEIDSACRGGAFHVSEELAVIVVLRKIKRSGERVAVLAAPTAGRPDTMTSRVSDSL